jgi:hypothetical protein
LIFIIPTLKDVGFYANHLLKHKKALFYDDKTALLYWIIICTSTESTYQGEKAIQPVPLHC